MVKRQRRLENIHVSTSRSAAGDTSSDPRFRGNAAPPCVVRVRTLARFRTSTREVSKQRARRSIATCTACPPAAQHRSRDGRRRRRARGFPLLARPDRAARRSAAAHRCRHPTAGGCRLTASSLDCSYALGSPARVIRQFTHVRVRSRCAFLTFTRDLASWWPVLPYSAGQSRVQRVQLDPHVGGHIREIWHDGRQVSWGEVIVWEPPTRVLLGWAPDSTSTEVEFVFSSLNATLTRVAVVHRVPEPVLRRAVDRSMPGGFRASAASWSRILACFAVAAEFLAEQGGSSRPHSPPRS
jgi:hypothetical protein